MSPRLPLIFGAGQTGLPSSQLARVSDPAVAQEFMDYLISQGQTGIDTSRIYCNGTSEQLLGSLDLRGAMCVDTKCFPLQPGDHKPQPLKASFDASVAALNGKKIRVFYLHKPDRTVPFEETLEAVNQIYKDRGFVEFGLSNFTSWEVAEVVTICKFRGFVQPTVYQGVYNLLDRMPEDELFPCLRRHNIKFAAYSVLAGGYLTDRFFVPSDGESGSTALQHFDPKYVMSWFYTSRYYPMASALAKFADVVKAHGLSLSEVSYRWLLWHSKMQAGDHGILIAATKKEQLVNTIADSEKGPLPSEVVEAAEQLWKEVKGIATQYWLN